MGRTIIKLAELINGSSAVSRDDASFTYRKVKEYLNRGEVVIDFKGIDLITAAFVNGAFGVLSRDVPQKILEGLSVRNIDAPDLLAIRDSMRNYSQNPYLMVKVARGEEDKK